MHDSPAQQLCTPFHALHVAVRGQGVVLGSSKIPTACLKVAVLIWVGQERAAARSCSCSHLGDCTLYEALTCAAGLLPIALPSACVLSLPFPL